MCVCVEGENRTENKTRKKTHTQTDRETDRQEKSYTLLKARQREGNRGRMKVNEGREDKV